MQCQRIFMATNRLISNGAEKYLNIHQDRLKSTNLQKLSPSMNVCLDRRNVQMDVHTVIQNFIATEHNLIQTFFQFETVLLFPAKNMIWLGK